MQIATVTTLNASLEDTLSFVYYHLNIGVDHIYLFFDNPNDNSIPALSAHPKITCTRCNEQHWKTRGCCKTSNIEIRQTLNADLALEWCKKSGIDWIAHIDIDELVYTTQTNLKSILVGLNPDISYLSIPPLEAIPNSIECKNPYKEITNFKVLIRDRDKLQKLPKKEETLYLGEYFRGHLSGKSFTRVQDNIKSLNIHKPSSTDTSALIEEKHDQCFLLHYDCYNYENWLTKWHRRYDGSAKFLGRENRNNQFSDFCRAYEENDNDALRHLYKRLYMISPESIELLKNIKAVKMIKLNLSLFDNIL